MSLRMALVNTCEALRMTRLRTLLPPHAPKTITLRTTALLLAAGLCAAACSSDYPRLDRRDIEVTGEFKPLDESDQKFAAPIGSCNARDLQYELTYEPDQVVISIVGDLEILGPDDEQNACQDSIIIELEEPLDGRPLVDASARQATAATPTAQESASTAPTSPEPTATTEPQ